MFRDNPAIRAATALAAGLFERDGLAKVYEMLIDKPPDTTHPTPWHQDIGYFGKPVAAPGTPARVDDLQLWIALDDVDVDNGCIQFVPRPHGLPSLRHIVASGDPDDEGRLLAVDETLDTASAVACPCEPEDARFISSARPISPGPT